MSNSPKTIEELAASLSDRQKKAVTLGCLFLMFTIAAYGLSLSTIQGPILNRLNGADYFSLLTLIASLAMCIMTPVGGRLGDMIGTRKVVLYSGLIAIVSGLIISFTSNLYIFLIFRFVLALAQGTFVTSPYILVREINEPKDVPKAMGLLTAALALGSLTGSYLAGVFTDMNMMTLAILFPVLSLAAAIPLIWFNLPAKEQTKNASLDWLGILFLTVGLCGILFGLNYGPKMGWTSWQVLAMFAAGIVGTAALIVWEKKTPSPLIPLTMFENKQYTLLLAISFCTFFYLTALNTYVPLGVQDLIGASTTVSGLIQMPKTIVTVILPMFCGAWIVKRQKNLWIALAIACLFIAVPFAFLVFIGPNMPVWFVIAMVVLTGIADSFRSVSIAPAAQSMLAPKDLGVGTSLIGFMNSLSGSLSAAICGIAYDTLTQKTPGIKGMTEGIDTAFLITAGVAVVGLILVLFVFRPMIAKSSRQNN